MRHESFHAELPVQIKGTHCSIQGSTQDNITSGSESYSSYTTVVFRKGDKTKAA